MYSFSGKSFLPAGDQYIKIALQFFMFIKRGDFNVTIFRTSVLGNYELC